MFSEVHDPEATCHTVEGPLVERQSVGVGLLASQVLETSFSRVCLGNSEHIGIEVRGSDMSRRAHSLC